MFQCLLCSPWLFSLLAPSKPTQVLARCPAPQHGPASIHIQHHASGRCLCLVSTHTKCDRWWTKLSKRRPEVSRIAIRSKRHIHLTVEKDKRHYYHWRQLACCSRGKMYQRGRGHYLCCPWNPARSLVCRFPLLSHTGETELASLCWDSVGNEHQSASWQVCSSKLLLMNYKIHEFSTECSRCERRWRILITMCVTILEWNF